MFQPAPQRHGGTKPTGTARFSNTALSSSGFRIGGPLPPAGHGFSGNGLSQPCSREPLNRSLTETYTSPSGGLPSSHPSSGEPNRLRVCYLYQGSHWSLSGPFHKCTHVLAGRLGRGFVIYIPPGFPSAAHGTMAGAPRPSLRSTGRGGGGSRWAKKSPDPSSSQPRDPCAADISRRHPRSPAITSPSPHRSTSAKFAEVLR